MAKEKTTLPGVQVTTVGRATRAESDEQLLESWLASLLSAHSRRNFEVTARRFLAELPAGACAAPRSRMYATPSAGSPGAWQRRPVGNTCSG